LSSLTILATIMEIVPPGRVLNDPEFYFSKARQAVIHPDLEWLMNASNEEIVERYIKRHPEVNASALLEILRTPCVHFRWSGADLFAVRNKRTGEARMLIIETNSSPSGQSTVPCVRTDPPAIHTLPMENNGFIIMMRDVFKPMVDSFQIEKERGRLCVLYDKNLPEARANAASMAHVFQEDVVVVSCTADDMNRTCRWDDHQQLHVLIDGEWQPMRAGFRYVTQSPHTRIPVISNYAPPSRATLLFNPVIGCLAGGRNKSMAALAYQELNIELGRLGVGVRILTPETRYDVPYDDLRDIITSMGYRAVVKVPYSNCAQGVDTILTPKEMGEVLDSPRRYQRYVVQELIGSSEWPDNNNNGVLPVSSSVEDLESRGSSSSCPPLSVTSRSSSPRCSPPLSPSTRTLRDVWAHRCALINGEPYVFDLRSLVVSTPVGFRSIGMVARRAGQPLEPKLWKVRRRSFSMLGTNVSVVKGKHTTGVHVSQDTDVDRILLIDEQYRDITRLTLDDLIDAYIQTCLCTRAIDDRAQQLLISENGTMRLFGELEATLAAELLHC
jgi:hypothetical protein